MNLASGRQALSAALKQRNELWQNVRQQKNRHAPWRPPSSRPDTPLPRELCRGFRLPCADKVAKRLSISPSLPVASLARISEIYVLIEHFGMLRKRRRKIVSRFDALLQIAQDFSQRRILFLLQNAPQRRREGDAGIDHDRQSDWSRKSGRICECAAETGRPNHRRRPLWPSTAARANRGKAGITVLPRPL